jgi:hypothetical protein
MNGPFFDSDSFEYDDALVYLGTRPVYGGSQKFSLSRLDRRQHVYCVGKTGTGKSTLLRNLILQDMYADCGVGVIDPHGDLARDLVDHVPPWRTNQVIYFNPADLQHPLGLNLLANVPRDRRHRVASGLVGAMKAIWADSWGPRLEYILYAAVAALLDCENTSILGLQRMLVDIVPLEHKPWWVIWLISFAMLYLLIIISLPLIYLSSLMAVTMYVVIATQTYTERYADTTGAVLLAKCLLPTILIAVTAFTALLALIATKFVTRRYFITPRMKAQFLWLAAMFDFIIIPLTLVPLAIGTHLISLTLADLKDPLTSGLLALISLGMFAGHIVSSNVNPPVQISSPPLPKR